MADRGRRRVDFQPYNVPIAPSPGAEMAAGAMGGVSGGLGLLMQDVLWQRRQTTLNEMSKQADDRANQHAQELINLEAGIAEKAARLAHSQALALVRQKFQFEQQLMSQEQEAGLSMAREQGDQAVRLAGEQGSQTRQTNTAKAKIELDMARAMSQIAIMQQIGEDASTGGALLQAGVGMWPAVSKGDTLTVSKSVRAWESLWDSRHTAIARAQMSGIASSTVLKGQLEAVLGDYERAFNAVNQAGQIQPQNMAGLAIGPNGERLPAPASATAQAEFMQGGRAAPASPGQQYGSVGPFAGIGKAQPNLSNEQRFKAQAFKSAQDVNDPMHEIAVNRILGDFASKGNLNAALVWQIIGNPETKPQQNSYLDTPEGIEVMRGAMAAFMPMLKHTSSLAASGQATLSRLEGVIGGDLEPKAAAAGQKAVSESVESMKAIATGGAVSGAMGGVISNVANQLEGAQAALTVAHSPLRVQAIAADKVVSTIKQAEAQATNSDSAKIKALGDAYRRDLLVGRARLLKSVGSDQFGEELNQLMTMVKPPSYEEVGKMAELSDLIDKGTYADWYMQYAHIDKTPDARNKIISELDSHMAQVDSPVPERQKLDAQAKPAAPTAPAAPKLPDAEAQPKQPGLPPASQPTVGYNRGAFEGIEPDESLMKLFADIDHSRQYLNRAYATTGPSVADDILDLSNGPSAAKLLQYGQRNPVGWQRAMASGTRGMDNAVLGPEYYTAATKRVEQLAEKQAPKPAVAQAPLPRTMGQQQPGMQQGQQPQQRQMASGQQPRKPQASGSMGGGTNTTQPGVV